MTWWVAQIGRAQAERLAIADLEARAPWLKVSNWHLETDLRLAADVAITHDDQAFSLRLTYPAYFPEAPPSVVPTDGRRLSWHQYGIGGELCLEFRADNWEPSFTGAMMLESAYRLIAGERSGDEQIPLPSAHRVSVGQQARSKAFRFLVDAETLAAKQPTVSARAIAIDRCIEVSIYWAPRFTPQRAPSGAACIELKKARKVPDIWLRLLPSSCAQLHRLSRDVALCGLPDGACRLSRPSLAGMPTPLCCIYTVACLTFTA